MPGVAVLNLVLAHYHEVLPLYQAMFDVCSGEKVVSFPARLQHSISGASWRPRSLQAQNPHHLARHFGPPLSGCPLPHIEHKHLRVRIAGQCRVCIEYRSCMTMSGDDDGENAIQVLWDLFRTLEDFEAGSQCASPCPQESCYGSERRIDDVFGHSGHTTASEFRWQDLQAGVLLWAG
jgi:hypothetical protein